MLVVQWQRPSHELAMGLIMIVIGAALFWSLAAYEGGAHGDQINLRGFSASDDFFLDGLRDTGFYTRDAFDYEFLWRFGKAPPPCSGAARRAA